MGVNLVGNFQVLGKQVCIFNPWEIRAAATSGIQECTNFEMWTGERKSRRSLGLWCIRHAGYPF